MELKRPLIAGPEGGRTNPVGTPGRLGSSCDLLPSSAMGLKKKKRTIFRKTNRFHFRIFVCENTKIVSVLTSGTSAWKQRVTLRQKFALCGDLSKPQNGKQTLKIILTMKSQTQTNFVVRMRSREWLQPF